MNEEILAGQWKQIRGEIKAWWGKLTDDDLDRIHGSTEKLVGMLQERYGYSKLEAQDELANFLDRIVDRFDLQHNQ